MAEIGILIVTIPIAVGFALLVGIIIERLWKPMWPYRFDLVIPFLIICGVVALSWYFGDLRVGWAGIAGLWAAIIWLFSRNWIDANG